jgi:hypothetical protein
MACTRPESRDLQQDRKRRIRLSARSCNKGNAVERNTAGMKIMPLHLQLLTHTMSLRDNALASAPGACLSVFM